MKIIIHTKKFGDLEGEAHLDFELSLLRSFPVGVLGVSKEFYIDTGYECIWGQGDCYTNKDSWIDQETLKKIKKVLKV